MAKLTIREKAARRDGDIGKLGTPGVYFRVTNWNTPQEKVTARSGPVLTTIQQSKEG